MNATCFRILPICTAAISLAGCTSQDAAQEPASNPLTSICRYVVKSGVSGGEVVAALTAHDGYSCADGDGVTAFVTVEDEECPALSVRTTTVSKMGFAEGTNILRSCNALSSSETPRSGHVLLARVNSTDRIEELENAALRGGYFVTYYLRENELHCFEVADAEKARAAGLVRLAERFAVPDSLTWTKGTCRQAVRNTYGRDFSWRDGG